MVIKNYIDKCNTIISGSTLNTGLNPVAELNYGKNVTRIIIHFPIDKIKKFISDGTCPDIRKFKHILKMTNCSSMDFTQLHCAYPSRMNDDIKVRASSFDLLFTLIPQEFDEGKGWDMTKSFFNQGYYYKYCDSVFSDTFKLVSEDGSNWYQSRNGYDWANGQSESSITSTITETIVSSITSVDGKITESSVTSSFTEESGDSFYGMTDDGVYSPTRISMEYDKYSSDNETSNILVSRQHFDIGNENIYVDLTDVVNKMVNGEICNNGIMISFTPMLEMSEMDADNYVGFFTNHTNTFFPPVLESIYHDPIMDNRGDFAMNKENRLYLYANAGGNPINLDETPKCTINDVEYVVTRQTKGTYYATVNMLKNDYTLPVMLYDTWSGIKYNGTDLDDVELYFTAKEPSIYFNIGNNYYEKEKYIPNISGIKNDEHIHRSTNDVRKLIIDARVPYTTKTSALVENGQIRLYVMDGESEITVIDWDYIDKTYIENFYILYISDLLPQEYHVDIRFSYNGEVITHKDMLRFTIDNDETNKYF